jgi:amino acid transporter
LAYGDFAGFLIAWGYWISIWASLPVIAVALAGSVMDLFPGLHNRTMAVVLTLAAIWGVVLVNTRGVKAAGIFAEITTYSKLVPFAAISILGLLYVDFGNFTPFDPGQTSLFTASAALAPVTMFAFLGLESATVPAGDVRDAAVTIPRATVLGISIAALLYVLGTVAVMGVVPTKQLVGSVAPFSDAARIMWGPWGATLVSLAVILSSIGALNGWTLLMGQVPMAAARDQLFPPVFARLSSRDVPAIGIIISAMLATALVLVQAGGSPGFAAFYKTVVGLSTMAAVIPYAFCSLAPGLVAGRVSKDGVTPRITVIELIAFVFAVFTLYGCGAESVLYGLILLILGIPVFIWQRRRASIAEEYLSPQGIVSLARE